MRAVYKAFPGDDAFIAVEALIDDTLHKNVLGPLTSLNMTGCEPRWAYDQGHAPQLAW
jgi:hypothetical protein